MKAKDIEEYEEGHHCFGDFLRVNGIDYEELDQKEVLEFINDMFENDPNNSILIQETFLNALGHLELDVDEDSSYSNTCDQCGNWNFNTKYIKNAEETN